MDVAPHELFQRLQQGERLFVLDVREPWEHEEVHIEGSVLVPLSQLPRRIGEVPKGRTIVTVCHLGSRSTIAADWLRQIGYGKVLNLQGGMDSWLRGGLPVRRGDEPHRQ